MCSKYYFFFLISFERAECICKTTTPAPTGQIYIYCESFKNIYRNLNKSVYDGVRVADVTNREKGKKTTTILTKKSTAPRSGGVDVWKVRRACRRNSDLTARAVRARESHDKTVYFAHAVLRKENNNDNNNKIRFYLFTVIYSHFFYVHKKCKRVVTVRPERLAVVMTTHSRRTQRRASRHQRQRP